MEPILSLNKTLLLVPVLLAVAVAGCGSSKKDNKVSASTPAPAKTTAAPAAPAAGATKVALSADPSKIAFNTKTLSAKAGNVTVAMTNPSGIPHAIAVEGNGVDKDGKTVTKGGVSSVTADLKPGKYTFYCPVDDHEGMGMKGTLTVK
jgi:plastocyanin